MRTQSNILLFLQKSSIVDVPLSSKYTFVKIQYAVDNRTKFPRKTYTTNPTKKIHPTRHSHIQNLRNNEEETMYLILHIQVNFRMI